MHDRSETIGRPSVVGVLGGTFDPPHVGHLGVCNNVLGAGLVTEIWLVPCLSHRFGKAPAPFHHRVAMCRLLVEGDARLKVSEVEAVLNRPGYTLDLIQKLMADHPARRFSLIAGQDIYHQKEQWHHYDEIAALAPPIYVARVGEAPIPEPLVEAPADVSSSAVRDRIRLGRPIDGLVPRSVATYIRDRGLYQENVDA